VNEVEAGAEFPLAQDIRHYDTTVRWHKDWCGRFEVDSHNSAFWVLQGWVSSVFGEFPIGKISKNVVPTSIAHFPEPVPISSTLLGCGMGDRYSLPPCTDKEIACCKS
jgi:hypothetical protein